MREALKKPDKKEKNNNRSFSQLQLLNSIPNRANLFLATHETLF
jgi:hypothetical protein